MTRSDRGALRVTCLSRTEFVQDVDEEEQQADSQFWNQGFFEEEKADDDYSTESEDEDLADSDFDKPESADEAADGDEAGANERFRPKAAAKKPPGWKQAAQRRAQQRRAKQQHAEQKYGQQGRSEAAGAPRGLELARLLQVDGCMTRAVKSFRKRASGRLRNGPERSRVREKSRPGRSLHAAGAGMGRRPLPHAAGARCQLERRIERR